MKELTKQLKSDLAYWLKRLRLQDWRITLEVGGDTDVRGRLTAACISTDRYDKAAIIGIANPAKFDYEYDTEQSLVHELLHLHLDAWRVEDYSLEEIAKETAINLIAGALVDLRKKGKC